MNNYNQFFGRPWMNPERQPGENDAMWQARLGKYGLTPPGGGPAAAPQAPAGPAKREGYLGLIDEFEEKAKGAYGEALGTLYRRRDYARGQLEGAGKTALEDNARSFGRDRAQLGGSLAQRGLYSTTLLDMLGNRSREAEGRSAGAIREGTARQLADVDADLTGDIATLQFANRPDAGLYSSAIAGEQAAKAAKKKGKSDLFGTILGGGLSLASAFL